MKMKGFKETCFLLFVTLAIARALPTCIQTDQSSKDLISEMVLLSNNLKAGVKNSIEQIKGRWPEPYGLADYPPFILLSHRESDNMQTRLKVDHCILKSFLPLLNCTITEFGAVSNTKGIVHKLKDLMWDSRNLIRHFKEARNTLQLPQPANQTTDSICVTPTCTVRSQSALGNGRRFIRNAVSRGKAILVDIFEKLRSVHQYLETTKNQFCS